jgi:N-ethylmaleimide reductase
MDRSKSILFQDYKLGDLHLKNRMVMAPMTRSRAINNTPNQLMAEYYTQRSGAGLIITEGTSPSPNGLGYSRIPGIFNEEQKNGWKLVTNSVHKHNTKIFIQLMHTGRVTHPLNLPKGAKLLAPSAIGMSGEMWTDSDGMQKYPVPTAMSDVDLKNAINEYVNASKLSIDAGFDGVELHGANGYLLEQFLNPASNQRNDQYGGNSENRNRFVIEVTKAVVDAIGANKVGIRISPYGVFNDMQIHDELDSQYESLVKELNKLNITYIHIVNHSSMGAPAIPEKIYNIIRKNFSNTFIISGGYDFETAHNQLEQKTGDLVAFGRAFLANPDLIEKFISNKPLNPPDMNTFYSADQKGYTDYPTIS